MPDLGGLSRLLFGLLLLAFLTLALPSESKAAVKPFGNRRPKVIVAAPVVKVVAAPRTRIVVSGSRLRIK